MKDSVVYHYKDSVRIVDKVNVRDSIVAVPLPLESALALLPQMMPSHLETSLAESDAYVDSLGLHHTLKNRSGSLEAHVPVTDYYHSDTHTQQIDSTATTSLSENNTQIVEVGKKLSWWQRFRINAFWWLTLGLLASLAYIFRKPLLALLKRLIG